MAQRQYQNEYPSVTTILGVLRKIGLEMWFKYNTAKFCDEKSAKGKLIGTQIHEAIQSFIETGSAKVNTEHDEEVTNALKSFMAFRKDFSNLTLQRSEIPLTSEIHHFNGTIDCIANDVMVDWKTGECKDDAVPKIYDEWKYQVAAYVFLYNEVNNTNIRKAIIVAIAKDDIAYNVYEMDRDEIHECFYQAFLPCLSIFNYQAKQKQIEKERKKNALQNGHEPRKRTVAEKIA